MLHLISTALDVFAAVPDPGQGQAPPGSEKLLTLLRWVAWIAYGLCVAGVIFAAAGMAVQVRGHGTGGTEAGAKLAWVLAGSLLIGSAGALVQRMA